MASIREETIINVPARAAWDALRDVAGVARRLAPGFVRECAMQGEARLVTFANGLQVLERIVDLDDQARRLAYSASSDRLEHHHASFQVLEEGARRCRVLWVADVLPHAAAGVVGPMMAEGAAVMKKTLEAAQPR